MMRKSFLRLLAVLSVLVAAQCFAGIGAIGRVAASAGGGLGPGFLPAGHFVNAKQALLDIFPRPDSETANYAREHQAYIGEPYDLAIGVAFGAYPYICTLLNGPPGMVVAQSIYNTFQNSQYCRLSWPTPASWNGEVEVQVTDQQHNVLDVSYALWTVGAYTTSTFSNASASISGSTLTISGSCTGSITPGMVMTGGSGLTIPAGDYIAFELTGSGCAGTYALAAGGSGSGSVTGAYAGGAIFISPTGSGSACTVSTPCLPSAAFGTTFAATTFPGAIAYLSGGTYSGTSALPQFTDNDIFGSSNPNFEVNNLKKPDAMIGIPGQTPIFDMSSGSIPGQAGNTQWLLTTNNSGSDWYMENVQGNNYNTGVIDQFIEKESNQSVRRTFDGIVWNNSGYGTGTSANMSMFGTVGGSLLDNYLFITDSAENNRETGQVGNNFGFCDLYSEGNFLIQRSTENSPTANLDSVFYPKSGDYNGEFRENLALEASSAQGAFSFLQDGTIIAGWVEIDYNVVDHASAIYVPNASNFTWGPIWVVRNNLISTNGLDSLSPNNNLEGPDLAAPTGSGSGTTLAAGTYTVKVTSLGVTGESAPIFGGNANTQTVTITAGQQINISWTAVPFSLASGYNVYLSAVGSSLTNIQFSVGSATSFVYTGQTGTTATPPATPGNALSVYRFEFDSNAIQTAATPQPVAGTAIACDSGGSCPGLNVSAASGLLDTTTGLLTGTNANPPSSGGILGTVGGQISYTP